MERPKKGDIAVCKAGYLGLVCGVIYRPDRKGINRRLWVGVHVSPYKAGQKWESRAPKKILSVSDFMRDTKITASESSK